MYSHQKERIKTEQSHITFQTMKKNTQKLHVQDQIQTLKKQKTIRAIHQEPTKLIFSQDQKESFKRSVSIEEDYQITGTRQEDKQAQRFIDCSISPTQYNQSYLIDDQNKVIFQESIPDIELWKSQMFQRKSLFQIPQQSQQNSSKDKQVSNKVEISQEQTNQCSQIDETYHSISFQMINKNYPNNQNMFHLPKNQKQQEIYIWERMQLQQNLQIQQIQKQIQNQDYNQPRIEKQSPQVIPRKKMNKLKCEIFPKPLQLQKTSISTHERRTLSFSVQNFKYEEYNKKLMSKSQLELYQLTLKYPFMKYYYQGVYLVQKGQTCKQIEHSMRQLTKTMKQQQIASVVLDELLDEVDKAKRILTFLDDQIKRNSLKQGGHIKNDSNNLNYNEYNDKSQEIDLERQQGMQQINSSRMLKQLKQQSSQDIQIEKLQTIQLSKQYQQQLLQLCVEVGNIEQELQSIQNIQAQQEFQFIQKLKQLQEKTQQKIIHKIKLEQRLKQSDNYLTQIKIRYNQQTAKSMESSKIIHSLNSQIKEKKKKHSQLQLQIRNQIQNCKQNIQINTIQLNQPVNPQKEKFKEYIENYFETLYIQFQLTLNKDKKQLKKRNKNNPNQRQKDNRNYVNLKENSTQTKIQIKGEIEQNQQMDLDTFKTKLYHDFMKYQFCKKQEIKGNQNHSQNNQNTYKFNNNNQNQYQYQNQNQNQNQNQIYNKANYKNPKWEAHKNINKNNHSNIQKRPIINKNKPSIKSYYNVPNQNLKPSKLQKIKQNSYQTHKNQLQQIPQFTKKVTFQAIQQQNFQDIEHSNNQGILQQTSQCIKQLNPEVTFQQQGMIKPPIKDQVYIDKKQQQIFFNKKLKKMLKIYLCIKVNQLFYHQLNSSLRTDDKTHTIRQEQQKIKSSFCNMINTNSYHSIHIKKNIFKFHKQFVCYASQVMNLFMNSITNRQLSHPKCQNQKIQVEQNKNIRICGIQKEISGKNQNEQKELLKIVRQLFINEKSSKNQIQYQNQLVNLVVSLMKIEKTEQVELQI